LNTGEKIKIREKFAWAMFDFANSGYTTVVLTTVFNSYFVSVIAGDLESGTATFIWTITIAIANALVLITAPLIGAIADFSANKKRYLMFSAIGCVIFTATLYFTRQGDITLAIVLVILSSVMFYLGESLIAAFLPEISTPETIGKISGFGWTLGYIGGLLVLGLCLVYVDWAQSQNHSAEQYVPITLLIVSVCFALACLPTFIWLKERGICSEKPSHLNYAQIGFQRLKQTWQHAHLYQDFFRFLITLSVFYCGINTVIVLAAIYAQEVMMFEFQDTIKLILVVNITAAIGAFLFGFLQDSLGSAKTLSLTLMIWILAMLLAFFTESTTMFWVVANLIGLALGSSQSAGRALIGLFSPASRNGEFFGLWGLAIKISAIIGPLSYGLISFISQGNHRVALLATTVYFIAGLILLKTVNEKRGMLVAAQENQS